MLMHLCQAGRLIFKPGLITKAELRQADKLIQRFCHAFYKYVYAGKEERLRVCRPTVVALLDVTTNFRSCGPAWSFWQFPAERLLGTLSLLIRSRRVPYAALTTAVLAKYSAEFVTSFAEAHVPDACSDATGKPVQRENQDPTGTFSHSKEAKVDLLPQLRAAAALIGQQLSSMQAGLALELASQVSHTILAKYFRMRLASG